MLLPVDALALLVLRVVQGGAFLVRHGAVGELADDGDGAPPVLNRDTNLFVFVDEAHRTQYGLDANSRIDGETLAIQPFTNNNGDVVWKCGNASDPDGATANSQPDGSGIDSPAGTTSILDKHMPASCRTGFGS